MEENSYSKWVIRCVVHESACSGIQPKGLKFKEGPVPARLKGRAAFYYKYNGGLKVESIKRHFPDDPRHQFEITPLPGRISVFKLDGVLIVEEEKLSKLPETKTKEEEIEQNNSTLDTELGTELSSNFNAANASEENHEMNIFSIANNGEEEVEPKVSKKLRSLDIPELKLNHIEGLVFPNTEDLIKITLRDQKTRDKPKRQRNPPARPDHFFKPKSKPRKCKKPLKEVNTLVNHERAITYAFERLNKLEKRVDKHDEGLEGVKQDVKITTMVLDGLTQTTNDAVINILNQMAQLKEVTRRMCEAQRSDFEEFSE